jgi:hypothetical protein
MPRLLYHRKRTLVHSEQEAEWASQLVWTIKRREKYLSFAGIRSLDRPARSLGTIPTAVSRLTKPLPLPVKIISN